MSHRSRSRARLILFASALALGGACRSAPPDSPVASMTVKPGRPSVEAGAPIDLDYRLVAVTGVPPVSGACWVFVHMLDDAGTLLWTDDHALPSCPSSWGTAPVGYQRTMFVPRIPYTGRVRIETGLFTPADGKRLALAGTDRGSHAYDVASFEMTPASNAVFVSFGDGWHGAERDAGETAREWRWTTRDARLSFRNPWRDAVLWLELDQPVAAVGAQTVEFRAGSELLATMQLAPGARRIDHVALPASRLGSAPTVDLDLHVRPTFVPASIPGLKSADTRELGVRVFNVHVGIP